MQTGWSSRAAGVSRCRCRRPHRASAGVGARCKSATPGLPRLPVDSLPSSVAVVSSETPAAHPCPASQHSTVVIGSAQQCSAPCPSIRGMPETRAAIGSREAEGGRVMRRDSPDGERADEATRLSAAVMGWGPAGTPHCPRAYPRWLPPARRPCRWPGWCGLVCFSWPDLLVSTSHAIVQNKQQIQRKRFGFLRFSTPSSGEDGVRSRRHPHQPCHG